MFVGFQNHSRLFVKYYMYVLFVCGFYTKAHSVGIIIIIIIIIVVYYELSKRN